MRKRTLVRNGRWIVPVKMRPANWRIILPPRRNLPAGSHRRVDVCACGEPALAEGSRCAECRREYQRVIAREWYRRKHSLAPERRRVA